MFPQKQNRTKKIKKENRNNKIYINSKNSNEEDGVIVIILKL